METITISEAPKHVGETVKIGVWLTDTKKPVFGQPVKSLKTSVQSLVMKFTSKTLTLLAKVKTTQSVTRNMELTSCLITVIYGYVLASRGH